MRASAIVSFVFMSLAISSVSHSGEAPVVRARRYLELADRGRKTDAALLEVALTKSDALPRWAAAVALYRIQGGATSQRALEVLADAFVADPPETRTDEEAYRLFNDRFVDPTRVRLTARQAKTVVARLLVRLDDLDPSAIARGERTRAVRILEANSPPDLRTE